MLRSFLAIPAILSLLATPVVASSFVAPIGVVESGSSVSIAEPSTLVVTLDVVTEDVTVGVYARYAQKLLGMRAPLVAKSTTTIASANIKLAGEEHFLASGCCPKKVVESVVAPLPIDATSGSIQSPEVAAERAASEIFKIRRTRRDMISGDLGEGYFGAGLAVALDRLDQEEQCYLELFMGRTTTTRESRQFDVAVDGENTRYIVCRYSAQSGVVDSSDLSAEPILLQITPSGKQPVVFPSSGDKIARKFRIADQSLCELFSGSNPLCSSVIPLFEFGYDLPSISK